MLHSVDIIPSNPETVNRDFKKYFSDYFESIYTLCHDMAYSLCYLSNAEGRY